MNCMDCHQCRQQACTHTASMVEQGEKRPGLGLAGKPTRGGGGCSDIGSRHVDKVMIAVSVEAGRRTR